MLVLLLFYIFYLIAFIVYSALGVYHLWRFGYIGDLTKPVITAYIVISAIVILFSIVIILTRQWPTSFNLI
ncbi:MAG: hypothetical protein BWY19_00696 [bacterium ADurb.Bin212]|nr:MAG: hypothetical protein BWY19_00696 [bacterium ADurb.Bin212]